MEIKINVYADCTSEKPSKTFVIRRILFKTAKELGTIQEEQVKAKPEEQEAYTLKMLQCVLPEAILVQEQQEQLHQNLRDWYVQRFLSDDRAELCGVLLFQD